MRIPPSVIVLPLILAVPFGFAIRDSLKGNDPASQEERAKHELDDLEVREHDQQIAAERDQYERAKQVEKERGVLFASLIGREPASLGSAFGSQQLGLATTIEIDHAVDQLILDREGVTGLDGKLVSYGFSIDGEHCPAMLAQLATAWGAGERGAGDEDHLVVWVDRENHRRASFRTANLACVIDFTRTVDDAAWVEAAFPKVLRKTLPQAEKLLGPLTNPEIPSWYLAGPPVGHGATTLNAQLEGGKLTSTNASASMSDDDAAAVVKLVTKRLGKPPVHDAADEWSWADGKVTITYDAPILNLFHQP